MIFHLTVQYVSSGEKFFCFPLISIYLEFCNDECLKKKKWVAFFNSSLLMNVGVFILGSAVPEWLQLCLCAHHLPPVGHLHTLNVRLRQKHFYWSDFIKSWSTLFIFFSFLSFSLKIKGLLSFINSQPVDGSGLNTYLISLSHLEMLGSLWLFIERKMLTRSVPRKRFGIVRDSIAKTYLLYYLGQFVIDLYIPWHDTGQIAWKKSISSYIGTEDISV